MRYLVGLAVAFALVAGPLSVSAQGGGEGVTSEPKLREPASSPTPESEVPDIETLSQRAIEHYEEMKAQPRSAKQQRKRRRRQGGTGRKAGIALGVIAGVTLVGLGIAAPIAVSNSFD